MAAEPAPSAPRWEAWILARQDLRLLLLLFAVACAARILYLGRADLWGDEILFINLSSPPVTPWQAIVNHWTQFSAIGHMPLGAALHSLVLWPFAGTPDLGHHAFLQRLPAVLWGSLQVPLVYLLGALVAGRREGRTAAGLMAVSLFPVFFAREAYYYAPLMLWATVSLLVLVSILKVGRLTRGAGWALALALGITTLTHINGVTISLGGLLLATLSLMLKRYPSPGEPAKARQLMGRLWLLCAAGVAAGLPFFIKRLLHPSNQVFQQQPSALEALHDFLGKTLLGTNLPQGVLGWVLVALGLWAIARRDEGRPLRLAVLVLFVVPFVIVLFSAIHTLYYARYFNGVLGLYYVLVALGIGRLLDLLGGRRWLQPAVLALLLAPHLVLLLPTMYQLPAKGVNYGGIARWLTANLPPGTPFVMESAYELRFTSGFFPTPNLVPAAPYVHGAGAAEMKRLRDSQHTFLEHFPEAPFIESCRTGSEPGAPYGLWEWPHQFFRQRHDLRNVALQRMAEWGVWPQVPLNRVSDLQYLTPIWYNTPADREAAARARGEPLLLSFTDWMTRPIQQGVYARVKTGAWGAVTVTNLTEGSVRGRFVLQGALVAPEQSYEVHLKWMGQLLGTTTRWGGSMWSVESGEVVVPRREGRLEWGVPADKAAGLQALIMQELRFVPSPSP